MAVGEPVSISGLQIRSDDPLHGDANGVVQIPADCGPELAAAAQRIIEQEAETLRRIKSPDFTVGPTPDLKY